MTEEKGTSVRREVTVRCSAEHAFAVFATRIELWWPRGHRPLGQTAQMVAETHVGGRVFARNEAGQEHDIGTVLAWDPPHGLRWAWYLGTSSQEPTEVEVRFVALSPKLTRVEVVHRPGSAPSWDDTVVRFRQGWTRVMEAFAGHMETHNTSEEAST
ncbi:MAG: ATPase [Myxococcota bacterium]